MLELEFLIVRSVAGKSKTVGRPDGGWNYEIAGAYENYAACPGCAWPQRRACKVLDKAKRSGYVRVVVDGNLYSLDEEIKLEKNKKHNIEIVVDRLSIREGIENEWLIPSKRCLS